MAKRIGCGESALQTLRARLAGDPPLLHENATPPFAPQRFGIVHTVVIDHEEGFWPRYLSQTDVERSGGFFSSSDVGVAGLVTLPNKMGEIYATITNGTGYGAAETDRFKDFAARVSL